MLPEWLIKFEGGYVVMPAQNDKIAAEIFESENPAKILSIELETTKMRMLRKRRERLTKEVAEIADKFGEAFEEMKRRGD